MLPKIVFTDVDGVLTDGGMYYDKNENEWKKFNASDGVGVLLCQMQNIEVVFITGEDTEIVRRRAKKLKVEYLIQGTNDKLGDATRLCEKLKVKLKDVAYIGDDLIDLPLLSEVGFAAAPANAPGYVKNKVSFVTSKAGGQGAFREFIEELLSREGILESSIQKVLKEKYKAKKQ